MQQGRDRSTDLATSLPVPLTLGRFPVDKCPNRSGLPSINLFLAFSFVDGYPSEASLSDRFEAQNQTAISLHFPSVCIRVCGVYSDTQLAHLFIAGK